MNIEPPTIYAVVGGLCAAIVVLYGVVIKQFYQCNKDREDDRKTISLLTEHTIAQQYDMDVLSEDRRMRNLPPIRLRSQHTEFYRKNIDPGDEI